MSLNSRFESKKEIESGASADSSRDLLGVSNTRIGVSSTHLEVSNTQSDVSKTFPGVSCAHVGDLTFV